MFLLDLVIFSLLLCIYPSLSLETFHAVGGSSRRLLGKTSKNDKVQFYHGVASGDPTSNDLVIWTRVTPPYQNKWAQNMYNGTKLEEMITKYQYISVNWAIATSPNAFDFSEKFKCNARHYINCGTYQTSSEIDYTLKIIVNKLKANTRYYYQFAVGSITSEIGRTRTIPKQTDRVKTWRLAFASCKQFAHGYFTNLGDISNRNDVDMIVYLGDYIYEYPDTVIVNGTSIGRASYPNNYLYTLSHYRDRYLQHHLDENVQSLHQSLPWYIVWDDHEIVNDYWKDGAPEEYQNDDLFGVDFQTRKQNGYQAFFEWLPIRPIDVDANGGLHTSHRFGNLFDLILIDGRSQRTQPAESVEAGVNLTAEQHYSFGTKQREWFTNTLQMSQNEDIKWRIIGSDVAFGQSPPSTVFNGRIFFGPDALEGFHQERQIIFDFIVDNDITNIVTMSGGPHTGIAQKIYSTGKPIKNNDSSYPIFTEFVLDGFVSPKTDEKSRWLPYMDDYFREWGWVSPYFRLLADGYCIMDINKNRVKVEFWVNYNQTTTPDIHSILDTTFVINDGDNEINDYVPALFSQTIQSEEEEEVYTTTNPTTSIHYSSTSINEYETAINETEMKDIVNSNNNSNKLNIITITIFVLTIIIFIIVICFSLFFIKKRIQNQKNVQKQIKYTTVENENENNDTVNNVGEQEQEQEQEEDVNQTAHVIDKEESMESTSSGSWEWNGDITPQNN